MDWSDDLDAFVQDDVFDDLDPLAVLDPPPGQPEADAMLRRLRRLDHDTQQIDQVYAARLGELEAWRGDRLAGIDRQREQLTVALEQFMRAQYAITKTKTLNLPHGALKLRADSLRPAVNDDAAYLSWAKATDADLVKVEEKPKLQPLGQRVKKGRQIDSDNPAEQWFEAVTDDGEVVPGVILRIAAVEKFSAVPNQRPA